MLSSSVTKQAEEVLEEVLRTIREEYANPYPVLCEMDRKRYVEEEESLRNQLKETIESESSQNSWRGLLGRPSPQALKCLEDAQQLRQRVKEDINAKLRTRLTGKSNPLPLISYGRDSTRTLETDGGLPLAEGNPESAQAEVTSLLNMRCSLSEPGFSEVNVNPAVQNDHDYTSDINEAINSSLETSSVSSDGSSNSTSGRRRRSPPPLPPRRMALSSNSRPLSETSSNSGSDSPGRSSSVRRPAPPPPQSSRQSRTHRSPTNVSFPSPAPLPPDPDMLSSVSRLAQHWHMNTLASSIVTDGLSRQTQGRQGARHSGYVTKINCADINGSNIDGVTVNSGGSYNSGAVIHKTMMPPSCLPQHVPPF